MLRLRSTRRRALRIAVVVIANLVLLVSSLNVSGAVALGAPPRRPPVHVVPGGSNPAGVPAQGRFVPQIHAPTLPTGVWHPTTAPKPPTLLSRPAQSRQSSHVATAGRSPGEQPDLRSAATSTILNADGTWTVLAYAAPVHYQDANGQWQNIDDTLVPDSSVPGYSYANSANNWRVRVAPQAAPATNLLQVELPTATLTEAMTGAANVPATVSGRRVVYAGVSPHVDLAYLVAASGLEQTLVLHSAQVTPSFSFIYHLAGAQAHQDADGNIIFTDAAGQHVLFVVGGLLMYEAGANGIISPHGAVSRAIQVSLSGSAPDFTITLTPDATWLADSTRHFPVVIDPSLTWAAADPHTNTTNGNIYADTFVASGTAGSNYSTSTSLRIGHSTFCSICGGPYGNQRSYLKFPVDTAIPTQARVTSANLALWQSTANTGGGVQISANAVLSAWNATTLTWDNQPTGFSAVGSGTTSATAGAWVYLDVSSAAYAWWQAGLALNGLELQYADESKPAELFFSDDNADTAHLPTLTINYVQDQTTPSGGLTVNGGAAYTNATAVTLTPSAGDPGSVTMWSSNWSSVNGVGANGGTAAAWTVDSAGSQLTADTSTCGGTACSAQTFFTNTVSQMNIWPTFTAMFKSDLAGTFTFGVVAAGNNNTRFDVVAAAGSSAFTTLEYSTAAGAFSTQAINLAISPNTWYYGQIVFPLSTVGELYLWPAGQARPSTPTLFRTGIYMATPGLNLMERGDNSANLHRYTLGSVTITQQYTGTLQMPIGYGAWGTDFSNDGTAWSCPTPAGGTWCVVNARQTGWTLTSGDGRKTVSVRYVDDAGNVSGTGSAQIILDTTAPSATVSAPASGREERGVLTVSGTASDPTAGDGTNSGIASVALLVDGQQVGSPVQSSNTPAFLWDTTNVAPGEHALTFQATDNAGNTQTSASIVVDVSNTGQLPYETFAMRDLPAGGTAAGANVATGNAIVTHQDLDIAGRGPDLAIGRSYNDLAPINTLFGWGWTSDLDEAVEANPDGSVTYRDPSGGFHVFRANGSGGYLTPPGLYLTLVKDADATYTLTAHDQTKTTFNAAGYITGIADRNGNTLSIAYDLGNLPLTVTDASGRQLTITTSGGHITQIAAPGSRTYSYSYDGGGNLTDFVEYPGTSGQLDTRYTYDSAHRLTAITLNYVSGGPQDQQTNVTTSLTYDSRNRLVQVLDPLGYDADIQYGADGSGETTVEQLWQGSTTNPPSCYSSGNPGGNYECTTYTAASDGSGAIVSISDALGNTAQYQYDGNGNLTRTTSPSGRVTTNTYDGNGNLLSRTVDPGSSGHLNLATTWTYNGANDVLTETDPADSTGYHRVTKYTYDAQGNLTQKVEGYVSGAAASSDTNVTTTYTYDAPGELLTETDPLGILTKYVYDSQADVTETIQNYVSGGPQDSQTNVATFGTYDALGQQLTATDALGVVTQNTYDIRGNLLQTVANYVQGATPDSTTNVKTQYGYDALGRQVSVTNPRGIVSQTVYDADGRQTTSIQDYVSGGPTDAQTNVTTTTAYDAADNATVTTDGAGNTATATYDADNRTIEVVSKSGPNASPANATVKDIQTVYDSEGQTTSTTVYDYANNGSNSQTTSYTYDAAGRRVTEQDPPASEMTAGNLTTTIYDGAGNVTETVVSNGMDTVSDTTATFDHLGRMLTKVENPGASGAQTTTYTYDAAGRQLSLRDTAGNTTTTSYNALGRAVTVTHPDVTQDTTTYDANGRRLTQANASGTTTDSYDPLGRLSSEQQADGADIIQSTVTYTYDANGNKLTQTTMPAGGTATTTSWTYDKLDRPATLNDGTRSYVYNALGNVTQMQVFNGGTQTVQAQYAYDGGNRLTSLQDFAGPGTSTPLHQYSYVYDAAGNRSQITEDGTTTTTTYDGENQLLSISSGGVMQASFTYDANHNRTAMTTVAGTTTYTYDTAGSDTLLQQKSDPNGKVTTYAYDANGNLLTATYDPSGANQVTTYHYDSSNRLTQIDGPDGSVVSFGYDANGQRVRKTVTTGGSTPTTSQVNDTYHDGRLAYQTSLGGTVLATFTYDPSGVPESVVVGSDPANGPRYYYVYNGHGDLVALTDAAGSVVASYTYDAFGVLTSSSESIPNANGWINPYRYDGRDGARYDAETGLYWMGSRAYNPILGRFIQRDPMGQTPLFWEDQPFAYAGNNSLVNVDPDGLRYHHGDDNAPPDCGKPRDRVSFHWWGATHQLNHCAVEWTDWLEGFGERLLQVVAAGCLLAIKHCVALLVALLGVSEGTGAAIIILAVAILVVAAYAYSAWIDADDRACGYKGVFVNQAGGIWLLGFPGAGAIVWVDKVCSHH